MASQQGESSHRASSPSTVSDEDTVNSRPQEASSVFIYQDYSDTQNLPTDKDKERASYEIMLICAQKLPAKLNAILADPETQHIISWMPHGRAWRINDPALFVKKVMPIYFQSSNYNSFIRLINAWGFRRMSRGPDRNAYYHEKFLRGIHHLYEKMHRLTSHEKKAVADPELEPNFHDTKLFKPLPPSSAAPSSSLKKKPEAPSSPTNEPSLPTDANAKVAKPWLSILHGGGGGGGLKDDLISDAFPHHHETLLSSFRQRLGHGQERQRYRPLFMPQSSAHGMSIDERRAALAVAREEMEMQLEMIKEQERVLHLASILALSRDLTTQHDIGPLSGRDAFGDLDLMTRGQGRGRGSFGI
jgi:HSF-type DNA-binding